MTSVSAKCGHVKRRIHQSEPLKGKVLDFATYVVEDAKNGFSDPKFLDSLNAKLLAGEPLSEYEEHILVDVLLVHKRLSGSDEA